MNRLLSYLNKPAAYNTKPWVVVIVASLLVCFLLGLFQPFGINHLDATRKCFVIVGFTLVTAISTAIVGYLLPYLFKQFYDPSRWTIGKSFANQLLLLLLIALGNFYFDWGFSHRQPETFGSVLLAYIWVTLLVGIIPALVSFFIVQNTALKQNLNDAKLMNNRVEERLHQEVQVNQSETDVIVLSGSTKESITVCPNDILYLESLANYVVVNYLLGNVVKQKQLRTTISKIEQDLQGYPSLLRCHRAYMVNISYIAGVEGNSQGLQLRLHNIKEEIPVSRSYSKAVRDKL